MQKLLSTDGVNPPQAMAHFASRHMIVLASNYEVSSSYTAQFSIQLVDLDV